MKRILAIAVALLLAAPVAAPLVAAQTFDDSTVETLDRGIVSVPSAFSVSGTIDRLEAVLAAKGITVFARIDHAANAASVGMAMAPMELLIFGNPKVGTPAMQADPLTGLDLPLKALAYQDSTGNVFLAYNDPVWFAERHGIPTDHQGIQGAVAALAQLAQAATVP